MHKIGKLCVKFGHFILRKIVTFVANGFQFFLRYQIQQAHSQTTTRNTSIVTTAFWCCVFNLLGIKHLGHMRAAAHCW